MRQAGVVRATQNYLWSQTQAPGGGSGGSRAAAGAGPRGKYVSFPSQTQSKMLGGVGAYGEGGTGRFCGGGQMFGCLGEVGVVSRGLGFVRRVVSTRCCLNLTGRGYRFSACLGVVDVLQSDIKDLFLSGLL